MIPQKSTNQPIWRDVYTYSKLPDSLYKLDEIAHNLWWVWNDDAKSLFIELNEAVWYRSSGNPIEVLSSLSQNRLHKIEQDEEFRERVEAVYAKFNAYMSAPMVEHAPSVAYISMEYGLSNIIKIYSGGLGVLAGDFLKEASDSRVNMVGVGFLYRYGYFDQKITADGQQVAEYKPQDFKKLPLKQVLKEDGTPLILEVPYPGRVVYANVWRVAVGRIGLYLLDSDLPQNSEADRSITYQLYGGDWENRMKQEYLLGIGGILMLEKLGIKQEIYHFNEGHAAFGNLQRLVQYIEQEGLCFDEALEVVRASSLYTVHTPVPAGHDYFDEELFGKYMSAFPQRLGISWQELVDMGREHPGSNEKFSMSVFALNTCQCANGVSKLHGHVSQKMFAPVWPGFFPEELHVDYVTNGVHLPTWMGAAWKSFAREYISYDILTNQSDEAIWDRIQQVPEKKIWEMRKLMKERLVRFINKSTPGAFDEGKQGVGTPGETSKINPKALLIGFGRRFATYKRAHLLFTDLDRLSKIVNDPDHPVQFLYTGKAHPADGGGQGLIKHIYEISKRPEFAGKVIFIENYDIRVAQHLITGVDVWLNTPTRPLEASGTSGQKALMNGVLNFSVLDGWWYEGYKPGAGWALTDKRTYQDQHLQDQLDATTIYDTLEKEIIPLYYNRTENAEYSSGWIDMIKNSMNHILPHFTMKRMMDDYIEKFYTKLHDRSTRINADKRAGVRELVRWKQDVANGWSNLEVDECSITSDNHNSNTFEVGETVSIKLVINKHQMTSKLDPELIIAVENPDNNGLDLLGKQHFELVGTEGTKDIFKLQRVVDNPGNQKLAIRITPTHELLPHKMDFAYVRWVSLF